jgi:hypothetical protein
LPTGVGHCQSFHTFAENSISSVGVLAHCRGFGTCGWTDVGDPSTSSRLWDQAIRCPGGTTPGSGPSGQLVVPQRLLGSWAVSVWADSEPRPQDPRTLPSSERWRGRPAGWTWLPGTNLPTTRCQEQCYAGWTLTSPARAQLKRGAGPQWETQVGVQAQAV